MELHVNIDDIKSHNLIYKLPVKNQNHNYKNYYKLILSTNNFNLKYILIKLEIKNYDFKKENHLYKLIINKNEELINKLIDLEEKLLYGINNTINKRCVYLLKNELLNKECLYKFNKIPDINNLFIKISGLWENNEDIGIVYKIYYNMSTENFSNIVC